jgi:hypothetical protein
MPSLASMTALPPRLSTKQLLDKPPGLLAKPGSLAVESSRLEAESKTAEQLLADSRLRGFAHTMPLLAAHQVHKFPVKHSSLILFY